MQTVSLRYFNVFGPRQSFDSPYSGVIAKFCTAMLAGKEPVIFGDGLQARDFTYIDNVVQANLLAAEAPAENVAGKRLQCRRRPEHFPAATCRRLEPPDRANLKPRFEPPRAGDVRSSMADLSVAKNGLGYEARVAWQAGLEKTLEFYRTHGLAC